MSSDYILQLFREIHVAENDYHEKLNAQLSLPTAIVTVLCGVLAFYLDKLSASRSHAAPRTVFVVFLFLFGAAIIAAIIFLVLALVRYAYRHVSNPADIHNYVQNMEAWYVTIGADDIPQKVERDLRELMTEQYMECAVRNRVMNSVKAKHIHFAKCAIVTALLMLALSLYPFYAGVKSAAQVHQVQLVEKQKEPADGKQTRGAISDER